MSTEAAVGAADLVPRGGGGGATAAAGGGGGGKLTTTQKFLAFSTFYAVITGIVALVAWDSAPLIFPAMSLIEENIVTQQILCVTCLGWAVGKYVALKNGHATSKQFIQWNLLPALGSLYISLTTTGGKFDHYTIVAILYTLGYIYFGYMVE